jgi:hypothetical protein
MSSDKELERRVMTECGRQENIAIAHIGIAAREGLVTLTGHVPSNAERQATATAAGRVKGVKVVINQISINQHPLAHPQFRVLTTRKRMLQSTSSTKKSSTCPMSPSWLSTS